jgi:hypothetical protein
MSERKKLMKNPICLLALLVCLAFPLPASAQTRTKNQPPPVDSRGIVAEEFLKARPGKPGAKARRAKYLSTKAKSDPQNSTGDFAQLGLTLWRLRPAKAGDTVRMIVQEGEDAVEWTPERISAGTPMRRNDRIRMSFESPQTGYLYVVDREQYADGSFGQPELIFPTTRARGGDNRVAAGHIIELPGQDDRPNFFTMRPRRADIRGERLTVIVTPNPIEGLTITDKPLALTPEQVEKWEKTWDAPVERFELADGGGKAWTPAEKAAGADATRQLTQDDPGPQTIYRVAVIPGSPMLVKVGLRYSQAGTRQSR